MFKRFLGDRRANVATIFAIAAIPLLSVTGAVVDYTYGFRLRTLAQDALDAATLAGGKKVTSGQTVVSAEVSSFFASNVSGVIDPIPTVSTVVSGATVTSTATLNVPTHILSVVGIDNLEFDLRSQVTSGIGTLEVALALDNSGSMAGSKISTLKTAANDLVTTLYGLASTSTKPDPIKVGVVPFASSVNVGSSYSSASWMDTTAVGTYHADAMEAAYKAVKGTSTTVNNFSLFTQMNTTWGGCVEARPIPYDATDDTPTTSTPGTMFVPMLAADEPDDWTSSSSCSSTQKIGSNSSLRYNCALSGSQSYNNYLPDVGTPKACGNTVTMTLANPAVFTAPSAHGLAVGDMVVFNTTGTLPSTITSGTTYYVKTVPSSTTFTISSSSGGSAISTSGKSQSGTHYMASSAMWTCSNGNANCAATNNGVSEQGSFLRTCKYSQTPVSITVGGIPGGPNFMCTTKALTPLTTTQSTVTTALNAMAASGATNIEEGVAWAWRILSPGAPFTDGRAYTEIDNKKIIVLMTDGENTYYPTSKSMLTSWYGAWGYLNYNHLGTTSTSSTTLTTTMNTRTLQACTNAKAAGVTIYTVGFEINAGSANNPSAALALLQNCASSIDKYYNATDESSLLAAFTAIGDSITQLRIAE